MTVQTDEQLVVQARSGDKTAFSTLIERYLPMVQRIAGRMVADSDIANDLAQETLLQAYLSLDKLRADGRFRSWLYGITLNVCRSYIRSQHTKAYSLDAMLGGVYYADASPTPQEILERLELRQWVMDNVASLSPANQAAVMLFYYESFSLQETASALGISVQALKGRLHKARRQLAQMMVVHQPVNLVQGERAMIPVKIVDVMRKKLNEEDADSSIYNVVILFDEVDRRALCIWVGEAEGMAIAMGLSDYDAPRPMTPIFMSRLLEAAGASLESVQISTLKNETFYATVRIQANGRINEFDARPSDALALAVHAKAPVYVSEEVMRLTGQAVPAGQKVTGKGLATVLDHLDKQSQQWKAKISELQEQSTERRVQKITQETQALLAEAFTS